MGARLEYAKIIDKELYYTKGARIHPGLDNEVSLLEEPGAAGAFLVLRAWTDDHGTFTEQWRIESTGGRTVYESLPRELHLATHTHTEKLEDEVQDVHFEFAADNYTLVFVLDEHEAARVNFTVTPPPEREDG